MKISCATGTITQANHSDGRFTIRFQDDDGINDELSFKKNEQQLKDIAELLETTESPTQWVGKRVKLIFGPKLFSHSNQAMLYGIGNENGNSFVIPEYIFEIALQKMCKKFYNIAEVYDIVEQVERLL